jgi:glycosyltransferase involved in cell wall biosynthesis
MQGVHTLLAPLTLAAAQKASIPTVLTFHSGGNSSRLRTAIRELQWRMQRRILRKADGLVAVCEYEVEQFGRRLEIEPERIRLIRNGAGPFAVDETSAPEISGSPLICSVGRLERYKGHHRVVEAMPYLLRSSPGAHLAIVGRGPFERSLRQLVSRLGVDDAVTITSYDESERGKLGALVRSSDVVTLLSEYEANPVSVMEAIALGRKVVVADTSGLTELASHGYASLVPLHVQPATLAAVIAEVAAGPSPAVAELPTWDECVDKLLSLYREVARVDK